MAKPQSEGEAVRRAYDGPTLDHDKLIGHIGARIKEEGERSSDGSESAAKVSAFIEETGMNTQAYSWMKTIVKKLPKKDGQSKAMDVIRSIEAALPMIKAHIAGQSTVEMFPEEAPKVAAAPKAEPVKKTNIETFKPKAKAKVVKAEPDPVPAETADETPAEPDPVDLAEEQDDFDRQLAAASEE
jgi:hypothetical protein